MATVIHLILSLGLLWGHRDITHSCEPALNYAIQEWAAISEIDDGGCSGLPDIQIEVLEDWPLDERFMAMSELYAHPHSKALRFCRINVQAQYANHRSLIMHEVGHCLGLDHSGDPTSVMHRYPGEFLTKSDIENIQALYPPTTPSLPYRVIAPMLSQ